MWNQPGERYVLEGWEIPFFFGLVGSMVLFSVAYKNLPDTGYFPSSSSNPLLIL